MFAEIPHLIPDEDVAGINPAEGAGVKLVYNAIAIR